MSSTRFVLFVPQHQGGGTGEFFRLLTIAHALRERDPSVRIEFLMPQACPLLPLLPFPYTESDLPDDRRADFHARELARLQPAIVVFDKTCRGGMLRVCRRLGIRSICITDEPGVCAKAFRADWLWSLDEHWHQRYLLGRPAFSRGQGLLAAISTTRRRVFDVCQREDPEAALAPTTPFLLFVPGGGGYRIDGRPVADLFIEAAGRVAQASDVAVLAIGSRAVDGAPVPAGLTLLPTQPQAQLVALMRRATIVVTGGGGLLSQVISVATPSVSMPLGGSDQGQRVRDFSRQGWTREAAVTVDGIATATQALLADDAARHAIRERLQALDIVQGAPLMAQALIEALDRARRKAPA